MARGARSATASSRTGRAARLLAAAAAGLGTAALPALAGPAGAAQQASRQPAGQPVIVSVTAISPRYAVPGQTLSITLHVRNVSGGTLRGLSARVLTSKVPFSSRGELEGFAHGTPGPAIAPLRLAPARIGKLAAGVTGTISLRVPVTGLGLSCFGVYPLAVQVSGRAGPLASDQTALPFWPGRLHTCPAQRPRPDPIAWIWPLIDRPHQGPCPGLLDNRLAASVAPGGRLYDLLAVGRKYATSARLTWVIDPALLDNVHTMGSPYAVGAGPGCQGGKTMAASPAARTWLATAVQATAGHLVIATPYADVDVAALTQHLRNLDASRAFAEGQSVAGLYLKREFAAGRRLPVGRRLAAVAWPADGIANYPLLENLASFQVGTVILNSAVMPPVTAVSYTPGGVTSTPDGVGTQMRVLLADDALTRFLGSHDAASASPAANFRVRQLFLAETAMIVAERPGVRRPIVVAPPRRWKPSDRVASGLLADTVAAPWLQPSTTGRLLTLPADHLPRSQPRSVSPAELSRRLLRKMAKLDRKVALLESVQVPGQPNLLLYRAAFGVESSAWRGSKAAEHRARTLLNRTSRYIAGQWRQLSVGGFSNVTLGGTISTVRMHISNRLDYPVQVKLVVTASNRSLRASVVGTTKGIITIPTHVTLTVKLAVKASTGGAAKITISLHSPNGRPLPIKPLVMHIRATQFGTVALVICAAALAVFVIASAARAIRMGRPAPPGPAGEGSTQPEPTGGGDALLEADADVPAQAAPAEPPGGAEKPATVEADEPPELMPTGPVLADQAKPTTGRHQEGR